MKTTKVLLTALAATLLVAGSVLASDSWRGHNPQRGSAFSESVISIHESGRHGYGGSDLFVGSQAGARGPNARTTTFATVGPRGIFTAASARSGGGNMHRPVHEVRHREISHRNRGNGDRDIHRPGGREVRHRYISHRNRGGDQGGRRHHSGR